MGIASQTITPLQAAQTKHAARVQLNARMYMQLQASQAASFAEFWADPINQALSWGNDLQGCFTVFAAINQSLLLLWLHDKPGVAVVIPGLALTANADPTLAASYTAVCAPGWSITWNTDGSGTPVQTTSKS